MTAGVVGINAGSPLAVEENGVSGSFRPVLSVRFFPIPFFRIRFFPVLSPLAVEENWVSRSFSTRVLGFCGEECGYRYVVVGSEAVADRSSIVR